MKGFGWEGSFLAGTKIKNKISKKTRAIIVPHIFGFPADIVSIKENFDIPIIEDCATTLGSKINNNFTILDFFVDQFEWINQCGKDDNCSAMLVIMKYRYI